MQENKILPVDIPVYGYIGNYNDFENSMIPYQVTQMWRNFAIVNPKVEMYDHPSIDDVLRTYNAYSIQNGATVYFRFHVPEDAAVFKLKYS